MEHSELLKFKNDLLQEDHNCPAVTDIVIMCIGGIAEEKSESYLFDYVNLGYREIKLLAQFLTRVTTFTPEELKVLYEELVDG